MLYRPEEEFDRIALATAIETKLIDCGFTREETDSNQERIYSRPVKDGMMIQVYTSVVGDQVREAGKDAIRVAGVFRKDNATRGITKEKRINRVGEIEEIVDRMYQRMRNAWVDCNVAERCPKCGAPKFISRSGNKVCAAICWNKKEEA